MTVTAADLYERLPAHYREVDERNGGVVRALLGVIARQGDALQRDIETLGDSWFIETCPPWVVPYLGDLLGVTPFHTVEGMPAPRALVANTLGYRRRKGTAAVLAAVARDMTGWSAVAVELFELLKATQHTNHPRPHSLATVDLHAADALERADGPFDELAHSVDVRRIETMGLHHNVPNIAVFLWRLQEQFIGDATAQPADDPSEGRYHIDPLGRALPLWNTPRLETGIDERAGMPHVAGELRRRPLRDELAARRAALIAGEDPPAGYWDDRPPIRVRFRATGTDPYVGVDPENLVVCVLDPWRRPPAGRVGFDPVTGRVAFPQGQVPDRVLVSSATASPGPIGAGTYPRPDVRETLGGDKVDWQAGVARDLPPGNGIFATLKEAVAEWNAQPAGRRGVIVVVDNHRFDEDITGADRIRIKRGSHLAIVAARWPSVPVPGGAPDDTFRPTGHFEPSGVRPCIAGDVEVVGTAPGDSPNPGEFVLDGFLLEGGLNVAKQGALQLRRGTLGHCTLVPAAGGIEIAAGLERTEIVVRRSICGPISLSEDATALRIADSIVHGDVEAPGADAELDAVTVLGTLRARSLGASDCLFTDPLDITRRQIGCVRFSYVAPGSATPRRYRCQPDLALEENAGSAAVIAGRLTPTFTSTEFGDAAYGQLGVGAADELLTGAHDGSEMGAFHLVHAHQRIANLRSAIDEYVRYGLELGLLFAT